jgi:hypothetical protein
MQNTLFYGNLNQLMFLLVLPWPVFMEIGIWKLDTFLDEIGQASAQHFSSKSGVLDGICKLKPFAANIRKSMDSHLNYLT